MQTRALVWLDRLGRDSGLQTVKCQLISWVMQHQGPFVFQTSYTYYWIGHPEVNVPLRMNCIIYIVIFKNTFVYISPIIRADSHHLLVLFPCSTGCCKFILFWEAFGLPVHVSLKAEIVTSTDNSKQDSGACVEAINSFPEGLIYQYLQ